MSVEFDISQIQVITVEPPKDVSRAGIEIGCDELFASDILESANMKTLKISAPPGRK